MARAEVQHRLEPTEVQRLDPSTLDSNKHYRFVHPRNAARRRSQGYEVVLRSESGVKFLWEDGEDVAAVSDDRIRIGESFLMCCKKEVYRARRKMYQELNDRRLGSVEAKFQERARKKGVRSLTGDEEE